MTELENKVKRWALARRSLLSYLNERDEWVKAGKSGNEVIQPLPQSLTELWNGLSNAEWALFDEIKDSLSD